MKARAKKNVDELRPEYDLKTLLKTGVREKYTERYRKGTNLVLLEPDVADEFQDAKTVNETLRLVIQLRKRPKAKTKLKRAVQA